MQQSAWSCVDYFKTAWIVALLHHSRRAGSDAYLLPLPSNSRQPQAPAARSCATHSRPRRHCLLSCGRQPRAPAQQTANCFPVTWLAPRLALTAAPALLPGPAPASLCPGPPRLRAPAHTQKNTRPHSTLPNTATSPKYCASHEPCELTERALSRVPSCFYYGGD